MNSSVQRIFISDLPEAATDSEIKSLFSKYGEVTSIEIKTRKELTAKNKSHFFAYVNLDTDHHNLNQCFRDFQEEPWHGDYVKLQIAKESFLDRLKREREETQHKQQRQESADNALLPDVHPIVNIPPPKKPKYEIDITIDEIALESDKNEAQIDLNEKRVPKIRKTMPQNKIVNKIPSFGNEPIVVFNTKKDKSKNMSEANLKRLESLKNLKKGYQAGKDFIKNALQNIDSKPRNNKIVFDDDGKSTDYQKTQVNGFHKNKNTLFDHEDSDFDDFEGNFEIQEHLEGEKGKKLLELQSKFQNDKRFALDKRFLDNDLPKSDNVEEDKEESFETEKKKELNILEQVLGKKLSKPISGKVEKKTPQKAMLRFDPTQNNSNFELEKVIEEPKKKKTRKELKQDAEKAQNMEKPEVSKEIFYKVSDNLKETFQETQGFSLLSTFKRTNDDNIEQDNKTGVPKHSSSKNPFRYDSSDEEDETADIPHTSDTSKIDTRQNQPTTSTRSVFWTESFFFKPDDHRLQDGFDFVEKLKVSDNNEFSKLRQDLKSVVRTKMRNSDRKNRMFKKKLGGSKSSRRKHIRIKKALKR